ncbi:S24 family peptidase, partial [Acinetobacter baumannii]
YNISDSDEALLFSTIIEKPFTPSSKRWVPVKAYSKMGMDGYFTDMGYEGNAGDGYVPTHSAGPRAYGIKGTGDSMFPAIRNGWYVVCDPDADLVPNEFVQVCLKDGRCTIKEFVGINGGVLSLLSVNGGERFFFEMDEVESITAITDIVPPSQHRQEHPYSH